MQVRAEIRLPTGGRLVLNMLANGMNTTEIAQHMNYTASGVSMIVLRSRRILKARTIPHLIAIAGRLGILSRYAS